MQQSVLEAAPSSQAAEDLRRLAEWVHEALDAPTRQDEAPPGQDESRPAPDLPPASRASR
jgi:hypothetical protein